MIKVSVLYPGNDAATFDMDYFCNSHIPMVKEKLGPPCKNVAVEGGLGGGAPESPPPYIAMGHLYFDTVDDFQFFEPETMPSMTNLFRFPAVRPTAPSNSRVGIFEIMLSVPPVEFRPNNTPCGPRKSSTRSTSNISIKPVVGRGWYTPSI